MSWVAIGEALLKIGSAYKDHLDEKENDEQRARDRRAILNAIQQLRTDVLDAIDNEVINEIAGQLEGFEDTYAAYDADPNSNTDLMRLTNLIDNMLPVIGRAGQVVDDVETNPDLALDAWAPYLALIYLCGQAMTEREVTYAENEAIDILPAMNRALPRLDDLLLYLRAVSDANFTQIQCGPVADSQDDKQCWYRQNHGLVFCGSLDQPDGYDRCVASRKQHMQTAFLGTDGVGELIAASSQLQSVRDDLRVGGVITRTL